MYFSDRYAVILCMSLLCACVTDAAMSDESPHHSGDVNKRTDDDYTIRINKCCERYEIYVGERCTHVNETDSNAWAPVFTSEDGEDNVQVNNFKLAIGLPDCGTKQQWSVYHYTKSDDRLILLPTGTLRHYTHYTDPSDDVQAKPVEGNEPHYYDYESGQYCLDKRLDQNGSLITQYAKICKPEIPSVWSDTDFLIRKIFNPIFHIIAIICYLFVAIVYFVIPTLRDLVGNIVTTIALCLIVSTAADLVRIFTELTSHVSFIIADVALYLSLLGGFFWLNSLGYYIWKMFRSRNVFLRVTDGRKYCYYSFYAWGCTLTLGAIALFAHFMLTTPNSQKTFLHDQETIGWFGIAVFFTPVACTILVNIYFYTTTLGIINRMHTYGRIHHKLKHNFRMFIMLFTIMSVSWLFLLLSWIDYNALFYTYVGVSSLQAPLFVYVCVFNQKHVSFLLRKSCCYINCVSTPEPECPAPGEWGDEMQAMNTGIY